jgi:hypothetical protein
MRKLWLLAIALLVGAGMQTSCSSQVSGMESDSRTASVRVIVSPGGNDVLRADLTLTR